MVTFMSISWYTYVGTPSKSLPIPTHSQPHTDLMWSMWSENIYIGKGMVSPPIEETNQEEKGITNKNIDHEFTQNWNKIPPQPLWHYSFSPSLNNLFCTIICLHTYRLRDKCCFLLLTIFWQEWNLGQGTALMCARVCRGVTHTKCLNNLKPSPLYRHMYNINARAPLPPVYPFIEPGLPL